MPTNTSELDDRAMHNLLAPLARVAPARRGPAAARATAPRRRPLRTLPLSLGALIALTGTAAAVTATQIDWSTAKVELAPGGTILDHTGHVNAAKVGHPDTIYLYNRSFTKDSTPTHLAYKVRLVEKITCPSAGEELCDTVHGVPPGKDPAALDALMRAHDSNEIDMLAHGKTYYSYGFGPTRLGVDPARTP